MTLQEGQLVIHTSASSSGPAKLKTLFRHEAKLEYMESIARRREVTVPVAEVERYRPWPQNRAYVLEDGVWKIGRIVRYRDEDAASLEIQFPNGPERTVPEANVYLRAKGQLDPMEVLKMHGQETPFFFDRRWPLVQAFQTQLRASRGLTGVLSSAVDLQPHQFSTVRKVLHDPRPRYLLADEVGLGKTIEAGLIIRQFLLDQPGARVTCLVPETLIPQWTKELEGRFYAADFPQAIRVLPHQANILPPSDLVVIDEAHHVAAWAGTDDRARFTKLAKWTAQAKGLLLLSATPASADQEAFLSMLHLLEPEIYALSDISSFRRRLEEREQIGSLFYTLDPSVPKSMLDDSVAQVQALFPDDAQVQRLMASWQQLPSDASAKDVMTVLQPLRLHISETYRLHRRMIRHRRDLIGDRLVRGRELGMDLVVPGDEIRRAWELFDSCRERLAEIGQQGQQREWALAITEILLWGALTGPSSWRAAIDDVQAQSGAHPEFLASLGEMKRALPTHDQELETALERTVRQTSSKIVIFTSSTLEAGPIAKALSAQLGPQRVATTAKGDADLQRFIKDSGCQVLIADQHGEEGLNLQCADLLIHVDVPLHPNRLEQRIGRLDRYSRKGPITSRIVQRPSWPPAIQALIELQKALGVFEQSIASLQYVLDDIYRDTLTAFLKGDYSVTTLKGTLSYKLQQEIERVEETELFDAIEEDQDRELEQVMEDLFDSEASGFDRLFSRWVIDTLQFKPYYDDTGKCVRFQFAEKTLVPWNQIKDHFRPFLNRPGTFSRAAAQSMGHHLLRRGEPFVDAIAQYLDDDDRGRSYGFWRIDPEWSGPPLIAFGLHFVVRPNPRAATSFARRNGLNPEAVKRQQIGLLGPRTFSIYVDHHGEPLHADVESQIARPYHKADYNLSHQRIFALQDLLSQRDWENACDRVLAIARTRLQEDPALQHHLQQSLQAARNDLETQWQQLHLRYEAGRPDVTSRDLKRAQTLHEALLEGLEPPEYHLDAVGVRVLAAHDPFTQ